MRRAVLADGRDADTRFYWKLTRHIFRYGHMKGAVGGTLLPGVHTVNEGERSPTLALECA